MTLGNGLTVSRVYDQSYRLTENHTDTVQNQQFGRDPAGNVATISDSLDPMAGLSLIYDDLYRLTSATGGIGNLNYTYDANGNRQSLTGDSDSATYQYTGGTNQLELITNGAPVDLVTDSAGNTILYGDLDLTYNAANRLSQVEAEGVLLGSYTYSADGRRVKKVVDGQTTLFHYDTEGRLIAESSGQGGFTKLYIYLEGTPLAMVAVDGANQTIYYYHTDHLGTPRKMTDGDANVVWAADYLPFGKAEVTVETVTNNLRYQGQYFDSETGLHYNYFRYYDPALGRYLRVDPIGLEGGMNPYVYVGNNPGNAVDPLGLSPSFDKDWDGKTDDDYECPIATEGTLPEIDTMDFYEILMMSMYPEIAVPSMIAGSVERASKSTPKLLEGLSKSSLKHISKHLKEFQKLNPKMDLNAVVNLGHKISTNSKNLIGTPGGRQVFEEIVNIGGQSTRVRAVLNTNGKLRSVNIRY